MCVMPRRGTGGWDWAPSRRSRGTRQRDFDGINSEPRKVLENAQPPTTIVLVLFQGSGARCTLCWAAV